MCVIGLILISVFIIINVLNINIYSGKNTYYLVLLKDSNIKLYEYVYVLKFKANTIIDAENKVSNLGFKLSDNGGPYLIVDYIDYRKITK